MAGSYPVTQRWIPDAFMGTMGSLLAEIAGRDHRSPIADNVDTVKLVHALYRSIDSGEAVELRSRDHVLALVAEAPRR